MISISSDLVNLVRHILIPSTIGFSVQLVPSMARADVFSISGMVGSGVTVGQRQAYISDNEEYDYASIAQPVIKAGAQFSFNPLPFLGVVGGASLSRFGVQTDAGHYKARGSTVIHEGTMLAAEAGLQQHFGRWVLQQTIEYGVAPANDYVMISQNGERRDIGVRLNARGGINLRAMRLFGPFFLGLEGSTYSGRMNFTNRRGMDEYYSTGGAMLMGLRF
jgi:hypothetical protein